MSINHQFIKETVRAHYLMHLGIYASELTDLSGVRLSYTHRSSNIWYNSAYDVEIEASEVDELIKTVETYMSSRNRTPCIYVSPATKPSNLGTLLLERGYEKAEAEAWTICDLSQPPQPYTRPAEITIRDVQTDADFEIFADIYRRTLSSPEVDSQLQACYGSFKYKPPMVDVQYFVASYDGEPAGILSSAILGQYNDLHSAGTLKKFRGKGIMRALAHHTTSLASQKGVKYSFGQALAGTVAERVWNRFGLLTLYVRECYIPTGGREL